MVVFIVLWSYLLTTKLRCLQKNNIGHTNYRCWLPKNVDTVATRHGNKTEPTAVKQFSKLCAQYGIVDIVETGLLNLIHNCRPYIRMCNVPVCN